MVRLVNVSQGQNKSARRRGGGGNGSTSLCGSCRGRRNNNDNDNDDEEAMIIFGAKPPRRDDEKGNKKKQGRLPFGTCSSCCTNLSANNACLVMTMIVGVMIAVIGMDGTREAAYFLRNIRQQRQRHRRGSSTSTSTSSSNGNDGGQALRATAANSNPLVVPSSKERQQDDEEHDETTVVSRREDTDDSLGSSTSARSSTSTTTGGDNGIGIGGGIIWQDWGEEQDETGVGVTSVTAVSLNFQRQCLAVAWIIAYYTKVHALEQRAFMDFRHEDFWNTTALSNYIDGGVRNVPAAIPDEQMKQRRRNATLLLTSEDRYPAVGDVVALRNQRGDIGYTGHRKGWNFLPTTFPWLDPFEGPATETFRKMMESFTYSDKIQNLARRVLEQMAAAGGDDTATVGASGMDEEPQFMGFEIRKNRKPAVRCDDYDSETYPRGHMDVNLVADGYENNHKTPVLAGSCVGVDWDNLLPQRIHALSPSSRSLPIYVAHRQKRRLDIGDLLNGDNDNDNGSREIDNTVYQRFDFDFLMEERPATIAAVEQVIMTKAKFFVASMHSPWSEYVIFKRIYNNRLDGKKNYDIWKDKVSYVVPPSPPPQAREEEEVEEPEVEEAEEHVTSSWS